MPSALSLTGLRFGMLLVENRSANTGGDRLWSCVCDCGNKRVVSSAKLRSGVTFCCGCVRRGVSAKEVLAGGWAIDRALFESLIYPDPNSGCFLFDGSVGPRGHYCTFRASRGGVARNINAHRVALMLVGIEIPAGSVVRHLCNTEICVNADHLVVGTHRENMADMAIANRWRRGELPRGVRAQKRGKPYRARYCRARKTISLGTFDTTEEAAEAVRIARAKMFVDRGIRLVYPAP